MKIEQIYTGCLAQGAYYLYSDGEAAIIDPLREIAPYLKRAAKDKAKIKYVFETHFHADFVSGHLTLAEKTDASIVYGPLAQPSFEAHIAQDGETFKVGKLTIKVLHTPGHTLESTTYLLLDEQGKEYAIFTGDTLFLGDVGRPDLAQKAANMTQEELAGMLYDSLQQKIMPLPDEVIVYPAHGAGSACGKNMSNETQDTLGNQKATNYALKATSKEQFIKEVTDGLLTPPGYFPLNVKMNKEGYEAIDKVLTEGLKPLTPAAFEALARETGALILDVRTPQDFAQGHVPGSIFIGLDGSFAPWVGELIVDVKQPILFIAPSGREEETIIRLSRVGFDNTLGYLAGGVAAWEAASKEIDTVTSVPAATLAKEQAEHPQNIIDVRKASEYIPAHIKGAHNLPLSEINEHLAQFPKEETFYLHCAGGYRSMIAASILKARGFHNLIDVQGGFKAIAATSLPIEASVSTSTPKNA
ncbi:MAG: rhodanese-like domain-containing protein [Thermonemataceae bacterium]|mgnify:CR=1 FL=1